MEASWQFQFKCEKISRLSERKFNEIFEKLVKFERIFFHTIKCEPYSLVTWGNLIRKIKTTISLNGAKLLLLWGKLWYFLVDNSLLFSEIIIIKIMTMKNERMSEQNISYYYVIWYKSISVWCYFYCQFIWVFCW